MFDLKVTYYIFYLFYFILKQLLGTLEADNFHGLDPFSAVDSAVSTLGMKFQNANNLANKIHSHELPKIVENDKIVTMGLSPSKSTFESVFSVDRSSLGLADPLRDTTDGACKLRQSKKLSTSF